MNLRTLVYVCSVLVLSGCKTNTIKPLNTSQQIPDANIYLKCIEQEMTSSKAIRSFVIGMTQEPEFSILAKIDMDVLEAGVGEALNQSFQQNKKVLRKAINNFNRSNIVQRNDLMLDSCHGEQWKTEYWKEITKPDFLAGQQAAIPSEFIARAEKISGVDEYVDLMADLLAFKMRETDADENEIAKAVAQFKEIFPVYLNSFMPPLQSFALSAGMLMQSSNSPKIKMMREEMEKLLGR